MAGLEFDIKAEVSAALANLKRIQSELGKTGDTASKAAPKFDKFSKSTGQATFALTNLGRVAQDAPFGFIGIANNLDPLLQSFVQLRKESGSAGGALKALGGSLLGGGGLILGFSLLTSALQFAAIGFDRWKAKASEAKQKSDEAASSITNQYTQVLLLTTALKNSQTTLAERKDILSQLNQVSDKYFGGLSAEKLSIQQLEAAYDGYINNLLRSFAIKQLEQDLDPFIKRLAVAQLTIKKFGNDVKTLGLDKIDTRNLTEQQRAALSKSGIFEFNSALKEQAEVREEINKLIENALFLTAEETKKTKPARDEQIKQVKELVFEFSKLAEIQRISQFDPTKFGNLPTQAPTDVTIGQSTEQAVANTERLNFLIKSINYDKQIAQAEQLRGILDNGINGAVDQFFNALANNQNPFDALIQSIKRLAVELGLAVIKAFALKALTTGLTGGLGAFAGGGGLLGGLGGIGGFATGGFVSQPTLATIAENGPEFVLRPDQLGAIMNMGNGGGGFVANPVIRGEDIVLVMNRVNNRRARNF